MTAAQIKRHDRQVLAIDYAVRDDFAAFCRLIGYVPHAAQVQVHANRHAPRRVLDWGRRTGKTRTGATEAAFGMLKKNARWWVVAPQHDLTERVWSALTDILCRDLGFRPSVRRDSPPRKLGFAWGSYCEGHSTHDPASRNAMIGTALDGLVWDECAKSPGSVWEKQLQPNLSDRSGKALFISTPEGYNHFYELFDRGNVNADGDTKDPDWWSSHAWCEVNMGNVPGLEASVAEARRTFSEEAFRQEWLGEFTTFAGRVYPEFDIGIHSRALQYDRDRTLALAFDFGVDNPFVCLWLQFTQGDTCYVIDEYTTAVIRDGREEVRQSLTTQENGEEVLRQHAERGYGPWEWAVADRSGADEIRTLSRHCGIRAIYRHVTPGNVREREVPAGIRRVRRFLREGRLIVDSERCPITTFELNRYRYPDKPEDRNASEVPLKADDHCLVAGTRIATSSGSLSIEDVRAGDLVWTSEGLRPVLRSWRTRKGADVLRVAFSDGRELVGTGNHSVWANDRGFIGLDSLRYGDIMWSIQQQEDTPCHERKSASTATSSSEPLTRRDGPTGCTSRITVGCYIGRFGKGLVDRFRQAWLFITSMGTRVTTTLRTSVYGLGRATLPSIGRPRSLHMRGNILTASAISRRLGIRAQKDGNGIGNTGGKSQRRWFQFPSFASAAAQDLRAHSAGPSSAPMRASLPLAVYPASMTKRGSAPSVSGSSARTAIPVNASAPVHVVSVTAAGQADVYNLTVAEVPEYFANGIRVHNCMDALRYGIIYYLARNPNADKRWDGDEAEPMTLEFPTAPGALPAFAPANDRLMARIGQRHRR